MTEPAPTNGEFEVRWSGVLAGDPRVVWTAITACTGGYLWPIAYEPRLGGTERGLTPTGGTVTVWTPPRHFTTRAEDDDGWFNELDYVLEEHPAGTALRYTHRGVISDDYANQLDACRRHTDFYNHSLGEYVRHFAGRAAAYVSADGPERSASGGFARVCAALGIPDAVAVGDELRLTPVGVDPVEGVVDYSTASFLGIRTADALYRVYGRDTWGWPVGVAHHLFADGVDHAEQQTAWQGWLAGVFPGE